MARPHSLSNWAAVREWEHATRERLRRRHALWWHGWCIGALVVATMAALAHLQMLAGLHSLALRYALTLGAGYLVFLGLLRWWAGRLVGEREELADIGTPDDLVSLPYGPGGAGPPPFEAGGGDFAGGGAHAGFDLPGDVITSPGELTGGALEVAGSSDDGAVVVIPVLVVFIGGVLVVCGVGALLMLYFGWEVLLTVAVEIAFGYASARTAVRVAREGWLAAAVRLTWKPLLGALLCAVALGAVVDVFVPQARSLAQAVKIVRAGR